MLATYDRVLLGISTRFHAGISGRPVTGGSLGLAADKIILPMIAVLLCVTLAGVIRAIGWFFEWYFIAAGLMLGRTGMAKQKLKKLRQQLTRLDLDYLTSQSVKQ